MKMSKELYNKLEAAILSHWEGLKEDKTHQELRERAATPNNPLQTFADILGYYTCIYEAKGLEYCMRDLYQDAARPPTVPILTDVAAEGLNDSHVDTALRKVARRMLKEGL